MRRTLTVLAVLAAVATGCTTGSPSSERAADPRSERPVVVATVWPFAWLAEQVAPGADVRLVPSAASADPHDVELRPREVLAIRDADAVIYVGDVDYQPAVERAIEGARGAVIAALPADDEADPHVWHRPTVLAELLVTLTDALAGTDALDTDRVAGLADELAELESEAVALLGSCPLDEVVVSHAGYGPMLEPLGIHQHAITGPHDHAEPTAGGLSELADAIREEGVPAVLVEPVDGRDAAETLARETGVDLIEILPLGTVTEAQAERGYIALYRENVEAFARALGCET